jgi:hypothetical protein
MSSPLHVYTLGIFSPLPKALLLNSKTAGSKVAVGGKGVWVDGGRISVGECGVCEGNGVRVDDGRVSVGERGVWVDGGRVSVGEYGVSEGSGVEVDCWFGDAQPTKLKNTTKIIM